MTEYDNRNRGVIFKNTRKELETHPDYTGTFTDADNREHWFDGWIKQGANGSFISFRVKPKEQQQVDQSSSQDVSSSADEDVPF